MLGLATPERLQEGFMCKEVDVLQVVVRLVLPLNLLLGLARVDALEDAQPPARWLS